MTQKTFNDLFKEVYYVSSMGDKLSSKYWLIQKYWDKVSLRLKAESEKIYSDGKERFGELMSSLITSPNPFLQRIPKSDSWSGPWHQPVVLGKTHGVIDE
jgi:hypothetical protein